MKAVLTMSERNPLADLPPRLAGHIWLSPGGCWVWTSALDRRNYGRYSVKIDGKWVTRFAHRVVYEYLVGPIPSQLHIDHLCKRPWCVRPLHLDPVLPAVNHARSTVSIATRLRYAKPRLCPQGHPMAGDNLYVVTTSRGTTNRQCRECRRESKRRVNARLKAERHARRALL